MLGNSGVMVTTKNSIKVQIKGKKSQVGHFVIRIGLLFEVEGSTIQLDYYDLEIEASTTNVVNVFKI